MPEERGTDSPAGAGRVIDAPGVHALLADPSVRIVDLRAQNECTDGFVPGALWLDYARLVRRVGQAEGMLPDRAELAQLLASLGIEPGTRVIAHDGGSGLRAARLLWTLAVCGHPQYALMEGGMAAWKAAGLPRADGPARAGRTACPVRWDASATADLAYVRDSLGRSDRCLLDVRSPGEYAGQDVRAARGGHIPGAVHFEWSDAIDESACLGRPALLRARLGRLGAVPEREIIPYCQSNRRSAFMFVVLKWLGYPRVRAYEGSWSEWGNREDTPVA